MKDQTKTIAENLQIFAGKLSKQCDELLLLHGTKLDQIKHPETYDDESIIDNIRRFKSALKSISDTVFEIDDHLQLLQEQQQPKSQLFETLAAATKPNEIFTELNKYFKF